MWLADILLINDENVTLPKKEKGVLEMSGWELDNISLAKVRFHTFQPCIPPVLHSSSTTKWQYCIEKVVYKKPTTNKWQYRDNSLQKVPHQQVTV